MLRVAAVLRRTQSAGEQTTSADVFTYEGLCVDFTARTVSIDGRRVDLSPKEYDLLFYLIRNKNIADSVCVDVKFQIWNTDKTIRNSAVFSASPRNSTFPIIPYNT